MSARAETFVPQPYPLHIADAAGRTALVIGWDTTDGYLCPVVVLDGHASTPRTVDPYADYFLPDSMSPTPGASQRQPCSACQMRAACEHRPEPLTRPA
jgi:hypothetical protein